MMILDSITGDMLRPWVPILAPPNYTGCKHFPTHKVTFMRRRLLTFYIFSEEEKDWTARECTRCTAVPQCTMLFFSDVINAAVREISASPAWHIQTPSSEVLASNPRQRFIGRVDRIHVFLHRTLAKAPRPRRPVYVRFFSIVTSLEWSFNKSYGCNRGVEKSGTAHRSSV